MLFSSYDFVFIFLPFVILASFFIRKFCGLSAIIVFLLASSFLFYGWSDFSLLVVLIGSIAVNFLFAKAIDKLRNKALLIASIAFNLGLLGYFKYSIFFLENISWIMSSAPPVMQMALPLGISFYTFQQIGYQVDVYKGITKPAGLTKYALFVSFFPQLIAGPIVHYSRLLPQLENITINKRSLSAGLTLFFIGLSKKVLIADKLAPLVNYYYANIGEGDVGIGTIDMWLCVFAYSFQLYFDFSGYADMALGIALCFSIALPINFFSPYKAKSLSDFWRRWHITLHDFLKHYVYIPLGGSRAGKARQMKNIVATMLLGGFWHGAGWTFILWGGLSGLIIALEKVVSGVRVHMKLKIILTFLVVTLLWIPFRAESLQDVWSILGILSGQGDVLLGSAIQQDLLYGSLEKKVLSICALILPYQSLHPVLIWLGLLGLCSILVFIFPNTAQIFRKELELQEHYAHFSKVENKYVNMSWKPNIYWLGGILFFMLAVTVFMKRQVEFLYFQF